MSIINPNHQIKIIFILILCCIFIIIFLQFILLLAGSMNKPNFLPKEEALNQSRLVPSYMESECECQLCAQNYNLSDRTPMMICEQQHNCCLTCVKDIITIKKNCPFCRCVITEKNIRKNRMIAKIIQEIAKKKGINLQVYQRPQQTFNLKKAQQRNEVIVHDPINDQLVQDMYALLASDIQGINNQSCFSKFCRKLEISDGLFCFTYFLTLIYNLPFFVCQLNYALSLQHMNCLDNDYGAGLTVRSWLLSSAIIGLTMYGLTWLAIIWKQCCFSRRQCPKRLMVINLILFFLKFVGWNIYGIVVISSVSGQDTQKCDKSLQSYMQALLVIQIVIICGLCSQFDKRR